MDKREVLQIYGVEEVKRDRTRGLETGKNQCARDWNPEASRPG